MQFSSTLQRGRLIERYKRFLADVRLDDGRVVTAHCANPGSMRTCLSPDGRVWLSHHASPKRKLPWTWEIAEVEGTLVYVNPARANDLSVEAIKSGVVDELRGYDILRREVRLGQSRIDIALQGASGRCYIEVKCATMTLGGGRAAFPDAVTARGRRHLEELAQARQHGARAVLLFCVVRNDARSVEPAELIDPDYARTLRQVQAHGVEVLAYGCRVSPAEVRVDRAMPVLL